MALRVKSPSPEPLKPLVFQVLLALVEGESHGWSLVRGVQQCGGFAPIIPGKFYQTPRPMLADRLIEEAPRRQDPTPDDERRPYFSLTQDRHHPAPPEAHLLGD